MMRVPLRVSAEPVVIRVPPCVLADIVLMRVPPYVLIEMEAMSFLPVSTGTEEWIRLIHTLLIQV